jgi:hypothetical protein
MGVSTLHVITPQKAKAKANVVDRARSLGDRQNACL